MAIKPDNMIVTGVVNPLVASTAMALAMPSYSATCNATIVIFVNHPSAGINQQIPAG